MVVVPRVPDQDGAFSQRPQYVGRWEAIEMCRRAGRDRVHVFDVENHAGTPVYVHAKVCVADDIWVSVGSDNFNRRSWTHDSELSSAVLDTTRDEREPRDPAGTGEGARTLARDLRLTLGREHLDLDPDGADDDDCCSTPTGSWPPWRNGPPRWTPGTPADGGDRGRPAGCARTTPSASPRLDRLWATPVYRLLDDPDGRPLPLRLKRTF